MSLQNRLGLLLLAFLLLMTVSVAATARVVTDQREDALVINLAGRQRMLIQQMTRDALQIELGRDPASARAELAESQAIFDQTLAALLAGGDTYYRPGESVTIRPVSADGARADLMALRDSWMSFQLHLVTLQDAAPGSAAFETARRAVHTSAPALMQQADTIVRLVEADSEQKVTRVSWVQAAFFISAVVLLAAGVYRLRRDILAPLAALTQAAGRIGQGDLSTPVQPTGPPELVMLGASLDGMRGELRTLTDGLETRVAQRTRELAALSEVIREISSRLELEHVLQSVTAKARELLDSDAAFLCLLENNRQTLGLHAFNGPANAVCQRCTLARNTTAERILQHPHAIICDVGGCETIAERFRKSHLAASLRIGERVIGALCVSSARPATYSQDQVRVLTELANSTAIALENARLYEQAERAATLEERQRIAAEMHDGLAQTLSYIQLRADRLDELIAGDVAGAEAPRVTHEIALIRGAVDRASGEVRQSIASLRASSDPDRTLQAQLSELVMTFAATHNGVAIGAEGLEGADIVLPPDQSAQLLRIVQEALQNAHRHASASQVTVCYERQDALHRVVVRDDGRGFDVRSAGGEGHFGLNIMRARAARIGAQLLIESAPGCGTEMILAWQSDNHAPV